MRSISVPVPSCASCQFFALKEHPSEFGACRRRDPRAAVEDTGRAVWPGVLGTDHCGEYQFSVDRALGAGQGL